MFNAFMAVLAHRMNLSEVTSGFLKKMVVRYAFVNRPLITT